MELVPIEVECHSGYKDCEYPKMFIWYEKRYEIVEIIDRWYQGDRDPEVPAADYFKVRAVDGGNYILKHVQNSDCWYLVI